MNKCTCFQCRADRAKTPLTGAERRFFDAAFEYATAMIHNMPNDQLLEPGSYTELLVSEYHRLLKVCTKPDA